MLFWLDRAILVYAFGVFTAVIPTDNKAIFNSQTFLGVKNIEFCKLQKISTTRYLPGSRCQFENEEN